LLGPELSENTGFGNEPPKVKTPTPDPPAVKTPTWRILLGTAYMFAMGVCGIVLTAIGSTLDSLAKKCGTTALKVSTVFLARGAGAIFGSMASGKLYTMFHGNYVMVCALLWITITMMLLAFCSSVWYLHLLFAALGIGTSITDTGCQIMTRKAHGRNAGPWLGANTVTFGITGALVPLMELFTSSLIVQFSILASVSLLTALAIILIPVPTYLGESMDRKLGKTTRASGGASYYVEGCLSCSVFCLIGGKVTFSSYIKDYIAQTHCMDTDLKSLALAMLWFAITVGRLVGLLDQIHIANKGQLYNHLYLWLVLGALGMGLLLSFPSNAVAAWFGIILYGIGNGPCVGYCYDVNNRITVPSEIGMAIVMFGLNLGASLVPYLTALAWDDTGKAYWLTIITFLTMVLPIGFVRLTKVFQKDEVGFMYAMGPGSTGEKPASN
jgi:predicted MFS family arabinose efflux permease